MSSSSNNNTWGTPIDVAKPIVVRADPSSSLGNSSSSSSSSGPFATVALLLSRLRLCLRQAVRWKISRRARTRISGIVRDPRLDMFQDQCHLLEVQTLTRFGPLPFYTEPFPDAEDELENGA
ncbi:hypothetical protein GW17_00012672 [Ensete ventricosum]|nr:hypothetical protein GW17_00012672 [Ensete ventricosum]